MTRTSTSISRFEKITSDIDRHSRTPHDKAYAVAFPDRKLMIDEYESIRNNLKEILEKARDSDETGAYEFNMKYIAQELYQKAVNNGFITGHGLKRNVDEIEQAMSRKVGDPEFRFEKDGFIAGSHQMTSYRNFLESLDFSYPFGDYNGPVIDKTFHLYQKRMRSPGKLGPTIGDFFMTTSVMDDIPHERTKEMRRTYLTTVHRHIHVWRSLIMDEFIKSNRLLKGARKGGVVAGLLSKRESRGSASIMKVASTLFTSTPSYTRTMGKEPGSPGTYSYFTGGRYRLENEKKIRRTSNLVSDIHPLEVANSLCRKKKPASYKFPYFQVAGTLMRNLVKMESSLTRVNQIKKSVKAAGCLLTRIKDHYKDRGLMKNYHESQEEMERALKKSKYKNVIVEVTAMIGKKKDGEIKKFLDDRFPG
jgi:hypothetical protein